MSPGSIHALGPGRAWRPLGSLLVKRGLISGAQLQYALAEQRRDGGRLGEILFTHGWVTAIDLRDALVAQRGLDLSPEHSVKRVTLIATDARSILLGRLLVQHGHISEAQLDAALSEQSRSGERLGQILIASGAVPAFVLATVLAEQHGLVSVSQTLWEAAQDQHWGDEPCYEVRQIEDGNGHRLYVSKNFLDATDLALSVLDEWRPDELNVIRLTCEQAEELCWKYP